MRGNTTVIMLSEIALYSMSYGSGSPLCPVEEPAACGSCPRLEGGTPFPPPRAAGHCRGRERRTPQGCRRCYHRQCPARGAAGSMHFVRVASVASSSCKNLLRCRYGLKAPGFHKKSRPLRLQGKAAPWSITARWILSSQVSLCVRS